VARGVLDLSTGKVHDVTTVEPSVWQTLRPGSIDQLPTAPGVFELGNLVRNVLLVGGEPGRALREVVREAMSTPGVALHARCLRFTLIEDPTAAIQERLAEYRAGHGGSLPPEQPRRSAIHEAATRRPWPPRVASVSRTTGHGKAGPSEGSTGGALSA
jgi:hypothetical protein